MKKQLSNSSGFTLAEVVVAAGMLGVVSLGVMQLMTNMTKGQKKLEQDSNVSSISIRAEQTVRRENNCSATLRGQSIAGGWTNLNQISRATDNWRRSNAADIAANKVAAFSINNVYGSAKDRVRLSGISYRAFHDSTTTNMSDDGNYTLAAESTYNFVGDVAATDGGANTVRRRGMAVFRLEFERQVSNRGTDAEAADQFAKKSFGSETTFKYIPVEIIANGAGIIQSCYSNTENFVESSCDTLDGTLENGDCKNLTVKNLIGQALPALSVEGNLQVRPDITDGDVGSIGVGLDPNVGSNSNVDIAGSVGVGQASTGTIGDLSVANSVGIGMAPTSNAGDLGVAGGVGVGVDSNSNAGDILINNSAAIGSGMSAATDGTLKVKSSVIVGSNGIGVPANAGSIIAEHSVAIGPGNGVSGGAGNIDVNTSASIGSGFNPNGTDGDLRVKRSIRAGGTDGAGLNPGNIESIGASNKRVTIFDGRITTSENYNTVASLSGLSNNDFVTRRWVDYAIASTLQTTEAAETIANYINTVGSRGDTYAALKRAICDSIVINGTGGMNSSCQATNIGRIGTSYNGSTNVFTITQQNPSYSRTYQLKDCSQNGKCSNVYSNAWIKGSYVTALGRNSGTNNGLYSVTGSKICIYGSCRTKFYSKCPNGQVATVIGTGGTLGCARYHPSHY